MFYIVNYTYNPNTAVSNRLLGYYAALDKLGITTTVVYLAPDEQRINISYKNINIIYIHNRFHHRNKILKYIQIQHNIKNFLKRLHKGDVVYTYGVNPITASLLKIKGIQVYAEKTEHVTINSGGRVTSLDQRNMIKVAKKLNGLFVISEPLRKSFIDFGVDSSKIKIINMTVNPDRFIGLTKRKVADRYIAYCGTVSNNKDGVDQLLKSFGIIAKKIPDIKLYIIGDTPLTEDKSNNLELIMSLGISDKVVFTGVVSIQDMPQLLKDAEALVLDRPDSIQAQCGFPTKLGEYLLTENPVIVTKVGDIPKFLTDGVSALLAEERNPEDFASKIEWVLSHKEEAAEIGKRGALVALKNFNCEIETKKIIDFIMKKS